MLQVISAPVHLSIEYPDCNQATLDVNESELAGGDTLSGFKSSVTKSPSTDTMTGVRGWRCENERKFLFQSIGSARRRWTWKLDNMLLFKARHQRRRFTWLEWQYYVLYLNIKGYTGHLVAVIVLGNTRTLPRINLITINWECAHVSSLLWAIRDIFEWGSSLRTGEWRMESRTYVQAFNAINHVKRMLLRNGNRSPRQRYNLFCFYLFSILASFQGPGDMLLSSMSPLVLI